MRTLLLLVALAAVITVSSHGTFRPTVENPVRTADFVPLPPHVS
jgi:hypothetical protein